MLAAPVVVAAALEVAAVEECVKWALLMVVFRCMAVPVAAMPEAPTPVPTAPVPTAPPVPMIVVAVAFAMTTWVVVTFALEPPDEPPTITPPEAGFVGTPEEAAEVAEERALLLAAVEPPVRVIMPV